MSRHRDVRNMNIEDELDDDAISDGGEADLPPEEYEQLMNGLDEIRATLGSAEASGFTDDFIKETLYHYYYDVDQAVDYLLEEQGRRQAVQERKEDKPLPAVPGQIALEEITPGGRVVPLATSPPTDRPHIYRLTEDDEEEFYYDEEGSSEFGMEYRPALSIISEQTEPSEESLRKRSYDSRRSRQSLARSSSHASTVDYGRVVERRTLRMIPPPQVRPSPSDTALHRLESSEAPPTASPSGSRTPSPIPVPPPAKPVSEVSAAPPTVPSKSSLAEIARARSQHSQSPLSVRSESRYDHSDSGSDVTVKPRSKLSALASSRASQSSRSSTSYTDTVDSGSVVTYSELRPGPMSYASLKSVAPPPRAESIVSTRSDESRGTARTGESTIIQRAIQAAIAQETPSLPPTPLPKSPRLDSATPAADLAALSSHRSATSLPQDGHPPTATEASIPAVSPPMSRVSAPSTTETKTRTSKLAQLAQAKAAQQGSPMAKAKAKPMTYEASALALPKARTEYISPIVNGPTATTAITTTYQSLGSLAKPERTKPSRRAVDVFATRPSETKQSKLAMKSKRYTKLSEGETENEPALAPLDMPMFTTKPSRSRATPSPFAKVLTDEDGSSVREHDSQAGSKPKESTSSRELRAIREKPRRKTHRRADVPPPPSTASSQSFAFDVPSPDDVVFNARRGTSLGPRSASTSTHAAKSTVSTASRASSATSPLPIRT